MTKNYQVPNPYSNPGLQFAFEGWSNSGSKLIFNLDQDIELNFRINGADGWYFRALHCVHRCDHLEGEQYFDL